MRKREGKNIERVLRKMNGKEECKEKVRGHGKRGRGKESKILEGREEKGAGKRDR